MRRTVSITAAAMVTLALATPAVASATPAREVKRPVATGTGGAVASADLDASRAGIAVLRRGGNAIDAAVATASTLGVTEPFVAGPGGGGYMVIYLAKQHRVVVLDGRETCPAGCSSDMFLDPKTGEPMPFEQARRSGLSVGVPGMVKTWSTALRKFGRHSLARNLQPAIDTARRGFVVDSTFQQQEKAALEDLRSYRSSRSLFLTRAGKPLPVGSRLRNPDLARTYRLLARHGADYLYRGALGKDIVQAVRKPPVTGSAPDYAARPGSMTRRDLARYGVPQHRATHVNYRGHDVYGMPPSSSGGIAVGEALNILSRFPMGSEGRTKALFHYLEASRLAFADRNAYVGDSAYVDVPQQALLSKKYAASRACLIKNTALTSPVTPGDPSDPSAGCTSSTDRATTPQEGTETNHLVTADKWGNVVSYTNTIEQLAGSGITVPGRGFLLNNELTDFSFAPVSDERPDPNLPAPGKRPRSSMSPTIVLKDGRFDLAVGSPGGATIITTVLQILVNHYDFGMSLPKAIAAPRASQRDAASTQAEKAFTDSDAAAALASKYGEKFTTVTGDVLPLQGYIGNATGIERYRGGYRAAAEPVRNGGGSALVLRP